MKHIAVAGFQHETNTFGLTKAHLIDFEMADSWPGLLTGDDVITGTRGINLPIAGCIEAIEADQSIELHPILWCAAEPSSYVTDDAFDTIADMILDGLKATPPIDGLYLDLHGAMVTESHVDGEGVLLKRIRNQIGWDIPIAVSLDMHANITAAMVDLADVCTIFRTYPHLDMAQTGKRAFDLLKHLMRRQTVYKSFRQAPFLLPLQAQHTGTHPCKAFYQALEHISDPAHFSTDIAMGFPAADIPDAGPSILSYAHTQGTADKTADQFMDMLVKAEPDFDCTMLSPAGAVKTAQTLYKTKPVVIADVQDNPGAGASADTTGLLEAMIDAQVQKAVLGVLCDPHVAALAHDHTVGGVFQSPLGGTYNPGNHPHFEAQFLVEALSDGTVKYTGDMYGGAIAEIGPTALLRVVDTHADVRVVVSSKRTQCLDQALFTHLGVDLPKTQIIGVKSTVHFRADFEPMADAVLVSEIPGAFPCRLDQVPYKRLRSNIRTMPGGKIHTGSDMA